MTAVVYLYNALFPLVDIINPHHNKHISIETSHHWQKYNYAVWNIPKTYFCGKHERYNERTADQNTDNSDSVDYIVLLLW